MSDRLDRTVERLTPLKALIDDPSVTEIHLLAGGGARWRRAGQRAWSDEALDAREVEGICQALDSLGSASPLGALDRGPLRWLRLEPPIANSGPSVFILRVRSPRASAADLVKESLANSDALKRLDGLLAEGAGFVIAGADPHHRVRLLGGVLNFVDAGRHTLFIEGRARVDLSDLTLTSLSRPLLPEAGADRAVIEDLIERADLLVADEVVGDLDWAWTLGQLAEQQRLITAPGDDPLEVVKGLARRALAAGADPGQGLGAALNLKALVALAQDDQGARLLGIFAIPDDPVGGVEARTAPLEALLAGAPAPRPSTPPPRPVDERPQTPPRPPIDEQPVTELPDATRPPVDIAPASTDAAPEISAAEAPPLSASASSSAPAAPSSAPEIPLLERSVKTTPLDLSLVLPADVTQERLKAPPLDLPEDDEDDHSLEQTSSSGRLQKGGRTPSSDIRARVAEARIEQRNAEALARSGSVPTLRPSSSSARVVHPIVPPVASSSVLGSGLGRSSGAMASSSGSRPTSPESRSSLASRGGSPEGLIDAPPPSPTSRPRVRPAATPTPSASEERPEPFEARPAGLSPEVAARLNRRLGKPPSSGSWAGEAPSKEFDGAGDVSLSTARTQEGGDNVDDPGAFDDGPNPTIDDGSEALGTSGRLMPIPRRRDVGPRSSPSIPAVSDGLARPGVTPSGAAILSRGVIPTSTRAPAPTVDLSEDEIFEDSSDSISPSSGSASLTEAERAAGVMGGVANPRRVLSGTINRLQRQPPPSSPPSVTASQEQSSLPSSRRLSRYSAINRSATFKPSDDEPPIPGRLRPTGIEVQVGGAASAKAQPPRAASPEEADDDTTIQRDTSALKPIKPDPIDVDETTELNVNKIKKALEEHTRTNPVLPARRDPENL